MRKLLFAAFFLAAPTALLAEDAVRLTRAGVDVTYTSVRQADGSTLITGRDLRGQNDFEFRVARGRVTGWVGDERVSFRAPKARATFGTVASR